VSDLPWDEDAIGIYRSGLVYCSVCAPADTPVEEVEAFVNSQNPTGISSRWRISDDANVRQRRPKPMPLQHARRASTSAAVMLTDAQKVVDVLTDHLARDFDDEQELTPDA